MDTTTIVSLIGSLGFPIVACGAMFWFMVRELDDLREVITNNTLALNRILDKLGEEGV